MNCDVVQRQLLSRESPDRPSADASAHLADCAACREWLMRLLQLERALPYLPVPPAEAARSALMRRILSQPTARKPERSQRTQDRRRTSIAMVLGSWIMDPHSSPRRRVAAGLVAGVAAALLLFITGWLVWAPGQQSAPVAGPVKSPADPLLAELRRYKVNAAETAGPAERVKVMADAAEELRGRATGRSGDDLAALARLYSRVVDEGIVKSAEKLSAEERRDLLEPIARSLAEAESEWKRLTQQDGLPDGVKKDLDRAALAAHNGSDQLRRLSA
jgi:hypothetical protein